MQADGWGWRLCWIPVSGGWKMEGFGRKGGGLRSARGVAAASSVVEDAAAAGWRRGCGVPLVLLSSITWRMVWRGRWGSQLSSQSAVGVNWVLVVKGCWV